MNSYVLLAKSAVEKFIESGEMLLPKKELKKEFPREQAGAFVTIENKGELRGCIGTYLPTKKDIVEEIIYNAVAAATEDIRFRPITKSELPNLDYTVYVLSEPQPIGSVKKLDPEKFGVIMCSADDPSKCGLLLPDLEGVETVEQQLAICSQKAGLDLTKENCRLFRFRVKKHSSVKEDE